MKRQLLCAVIVVLTAVSGVMAQATLPPTPENVTAQLAPGSLPVVRLSWDVPNGPWGFIVYRADDDSTSFRKLAMVNTTVFYDHAVDHGHVYFYYVTSVTLDATGHPVQSPLSSVVSIRIGGTPDRPVGALAGTVVDDSTGRPIPGVRILFTRMRASITHSIPFAITDSLGRYMAKLDTGVYKVKAEPAPWMPPGPPPYQPEWYDNKPDMVSADPVTVIENASFVVDFGLSRIPLPPIPKGLITGKVVDDQTQLPLRGVFIRFFKKGPVLSNWQPIAVTDSLGVYSMKLDTGVYLIRADWPFPTISAAMASYVSEWYDNVTDPSLATPVRVGVGTTFVADFGLNKVPEPVYATIEGIVTDTLGNPLRHATVAILRTLQDLNTAAALTRLTPGTGAESMDIEGIGFCRGVVWKGHTDSLGTYKARVLANRAYIAVAAKWGFLPEYYDNKPNPLLADIIKVPTNIKSINFSLAPNPILHNSISGIVRDSAGTGVPSILVVFPVRPTLTPARVRFGHTDSTGAYTIGDITLGTYIVLAVPFAGYAPAFYKAGAYGVMNWMMADKVLISGDVSGIDVGVVPIRSIGIASVSGTVRASGTALAGVRVVASTAGGEIVGYGLTDDQGAYVIDGVPNGSLTLTADRPDYVGTPAGVTIPWDTYDVGGVDFVMQEEGATDVPAPSGTPQTFALHQNYPNPFNPSTTIAFDMPAAGRAELRVFSMLGQEVATVVTGPVAAGRATVTWNARDGAGRPVASGLYFYRLTVVDQTGRELFRSVRKMVLVR